MYVNFEFAALLPSPYSRVKKCAKFKTNIHLVSVDWFLYYLSSSNIFYCGVIHTYIVGSMHIIVSVCKGLFYIFFSDFIEQQIVTFLILEIPPTLNARIYRFEVYGSNSTVLYITGSKHAMLCFTHWVTLNNEDEWRWPPKSRHYPVIEIRLITPYINPLNFVT